MRKQVFVPEYLHQETGHRPQTDQRRGRPSIGKENSRWENTDRERQNSAAARKGRSADSRSNQLELLSEQVVVQGGVKKRIVSKALTGQALRKFTQLQQKQSKEAKARAQRPVLDSRDPLPNFQETRTSFRQAGSVRYFGANTNQGIHRTYNEDRVAVILNIIKPQSRMEETWPKCSFFGVYDGHGGAGCADFLRDNLHKFVIKQKYFPLDPYQALRHGFEQAEQAFWALCNADPTQRSGSCAIVLLIVGQECFVANVGDSRAILSCYNGQNFVSLSRDHKPNDPKEQRRILQGGGKIFLTWSEVLDGQWKGHTDRGPMRILPGRLSLTRSFGDIQAKAPELGGNPKVLISSPEITHFKIDRGHDFVLLGCDGLFDFMESGDVISRFWGGEKDPFARLKDGIDDVLRAAINKGSIDNLTVLVVGLTTESHRQFRESRDNRVSLGVR